MPIEFIGGVRRTYQNMESAFKSIWVMALEPQGAWMADELSSRLMAAFGDEADFVAFDLSDVFALQEDEAEKWRRAKEQIEACVMLRRQRRPQCRIPLGVQLRNQVLVPVMSREMLDRMAVVPGRRVAGTGAAPADGVLAAEALAAVVHVAAQVAG